MRPRTFAIVAAAIAIVTPASALADSPLPPARLADTQLADPASEAQAKALMGELRCLVCQGQSIADSNAEMAGDMRGLVRSRIAAGEPPERVRAWLIARYGNWISYDPPLDGTTWMLWAAPAFLLVAGGIIALGSFRRRR